MNEHLNARQIRLLYTKIMLLLRTTVVIGLTSLSVLPEFVLDRPPARATDPWALRFIFSSGFKLIDKPLLARFVRTLVPTRPRSRGEWRSPRARLPPLRWRQRALVAPSQRSMDRMDRLTVPLSAPVVSVQAAVPALAVAAAPALAVAAAPALAVAAAPALAVAAAPALAVAAAPALAVVRRRLGCDDGSGCGVGCGIGGGG